MDNNRTFYHWSPVENRKGIVRRGLLGKRMPVCTIQVLEMEGESEGEKEEVFRQPMICMGPTPLQAWILSGYLYGDEGSLWDLWQVMLEPEDELVVIHAGNGVTEIRTPGPIPKRWVQLVGQRVKMREGSWRNAGIERADVSLNGIFRDTGAWNTRT